MQVNTVVVFVVHGSCCYYSCALDIMSMKILKVFLHSLYKCTVYVYCQFTFNFPYVY